MTPDISRRRFTVTDVERMVTAGILAEDERVELIAGEIFELAPISLRHMNCVNRIGKQAHRVVPDSLLVSVQNPLWLFEDAMPQPDLAIIPDLDDDAPLPTGAETLLVIEVSDTSRKYDRQTKLPLYAAAGIPEAWIFDLVTETIERHTESIDGRYTLIAIAGRGQALTSTVLPNLTIPASIIPKAEQ